MPDVPKRMSPERLEELRSAAVRHADAPSPVARIKLAEQRELIAEIDALNAENARLAADNICLTVEARKLAAECRCGRQYDELIHICDHDPTRPCRACEAAKALDAARASTDASGALARHGGGA